MARRSAAFSNSSVSSFVSVMLIALAASSTCLVFVTPMIRRVPFGNGPGGRNLRDFHMVCIGYGLTFEKNKEIRYNKSVISGRNSPEDKERRIKCISLILMM